jgi:hypothetical protein
MRRLTQLDLEAEHISYAVVEELLAVIVAGALDECRVISEGSRSGSSLGVFSEGSGEEESSHCRRFEREEE